MNPGAYAEFVDFDIRYISPDGSLKEDSQINQITNTFIEQTRKLGQEPCPGAFLEDWVKKAGFQDVVATKRYLPLGTWPADKHLVRCSA